MSGLRFRYSNPAKIQPVSGLIILVRGVIEPQLIFFYEIGKSCIE
jgi:hypothetical protein